MTEDKKVLFRTACETKLQRLADVLFDDDDIIQDDPQLSGLTSVAVMCMALKGMIRALVHAHILTDDAGFALYNQFKQFETNLHTGIAAGQNELAASQPDAATSIH